MHLLGLVVYVRIVGRFEILVWQAIIHLSNESKLLVWQALVNFSNIGLAAATPAIPILTALFSVQHDNHMHGGPTSTFMSLEQLSCGAAWNVGLDDIFFSYCQPAHDFKKIAGKIRRQDQFYTVYAI